MATLEVLQFPDERLRVVAKPILNISKQVTTLASEMLELMYKQTGIGLAATQVNIHQQLVVIDVSEEHNQPIILINPEITEKNGIVISQEGCLSIPEINADVERAELITVKYLDEKGQTKEIETDGLLAICLQHEIDHLKGTLFVDYLSPLKQLRIRKKLEKLKKHTL